MVSSGQQWSVMWYIVQDGSQRWSVVVSSGHLCGVLCRLVVSSGQ